MRSSNIMRISIRRPNKMPINLEDNLFSMSSRLNNCYGRTKSDCEKSNSRNHPPSTLHTLFDYGTESCFNGMDFQKNHYKTSKRIKKNKCCCFYSPICSFFSLIALILGATIAILLISLILSEPTRITTTTTTTTTTTIINCSVSSSTTQSPGGQGGASVLYTFDNTPNDYYNNYNAIPWNNPQYVSPGYNGQGYAIQLLQSQSQYLTIANYMNFYEKSLTVEAWIYPFTICTGYPYIDSIIYAQSSFSPSTRIMWMMLRNGKNYGAFQGNDVPGSTMFATNQWHHMAFTYNYSTLTQTVYVNGVIDGIHTNAPPCISTGTQQAIGGYAYMPGGYFDGYIDQLVILFNRAKSADEILVDATLVAYYSMDCLSYSSFDSGPNQIHGMTNGLSNTDGGRIGQSYLFNTNSSYFQATGFVLLGQSYRPFSFALWIRPIISITNGGTILHVSQYINGTGWCAQFIGLSSLGEIVIRVPSVSGTVEIIGPILKINQWVHIVLTYSRIHGLSLYVNGLLYKQSTNGFINAQSGVPMTVTLGQPLQGGFCEYGSIQTGFYRGEIDEFYIYSRELSQADVTILANP